MKTLPPNILKCLSAADRKSLGRGGLLPEEALRKQEIKSERQLQNMVVGLLRLKGIEVNVSRMDKRKTDAVGWPDLTFSVATYEPTFDANGQPYEMCSQTPCTWECKLPGCKPSAGQTKMHERLTRSPNSWDVRIIESVDQAIAALKEIGTA